MRARGDFVRCHQGGRGDVRFVVPTVAMLCLVSVFGSARTSASPPFSSNVDVHLDSAEKDSPNVVTNSTGSVLVVYHWQQTTIYCTEVGTTSYQVVRSVTPPTQVVGPVAAIDASNRVHVIWVEGTTADYDLYYSGSSSGCVGWSAPVIVNSAATGIQYLPSLATSDDGLLVFASWASDPDADLTDFDVYFARSVDGGASFGPEIKMNQDSTVRDQTYSAIATRGGVVALVWEDHRDTTGNDIYLRVSTDNGASFATEVRVNDGLGNSVFPALAVAPGEIDVAWYDLKAGVYGVYFASSPDGSSFGPGRRVNDGSWGSALWAGGVSLALSPSDGGIHVAWADEREGAACGFIPCYDTYYANSTDGGASFSPNVRVNDDPPGFMQTGADLYVDAIGQVHVAWTDDRDGNADIFYAALEAPDTSPPESKADTLPTFSTDSAFTMTASANDLGSGVAELGLMYRRGVSGAFASYGVDASPPWSWVFDSSSLGGDGIYEFYTIATDVVGNTEAPPSSADATTTVDATPPVLSILSPTEGASTSEPTVSATGTASDNLGLARVELRVNGSPWEVAAGTTAWSKIVSLAEGTNLIEARALDMAQNVAIPTSVTVTRISPQGDFVVSVVPSSIEIQPGRAASANVRVSAMGGFSGPITLLVEGVPGGMRATFLHETVVGDNTSVLVVVAGDTLPPGVYTLVIHGFGANLTRDANLEVRVTQGLEVAPFALGGFLVVFVVLIAAVIGRRRSIGSRAKSERL